MPHPTSGEPLFDLVQTYASLGDHRTGTDVDHSTARWMADALASRGLEVGLEPLSFDQWRSSSRLLAAGLEVFHLPVYYEWTGSIDTTDVHVGSFDPISGGFPEVLTAPIEHARASGAAAAVLVTQHPNGSLVAVNRVLGAAGSGVPTVLVAGRDHGQLRSGRVELRLAAEVVAGTTANVVATNGVAGRPLMLTTPLNGWFGCAGERGTGIAVLLDLVERFADRPLLVVATGGHELGFFGAHRWVAAHRDVQPSAIVHVGASVAVEEDAGDGRRRLATTRMALTSVPTRRAGALAAPLARAGLDLRADNERWIGEGEAWSRIGVPLLSFTGAGVDFHTPEDTPERATSPDALAAVAAAIGDAAQALDDRARRGVSAGGSGA